MAAAQYGVPASRASLYCTHARKGTRRKPTQQAGEGEAWVSGAGMEKKNVCVREGAAGCPSPTHLGQDGEPFHQDGVAAGRGPRGGEGEDAGGQAQRRERLGGGTRGEGDNRGEI